MLKQLCSHRPQDEKYMAGVFEKRRNQHWEVKGSMTFVVTRGINEYHPNVYGMLS